MAAAGYLRIVVLAVFSGGLASGMLTENGLAWWVVAGLGASGCAFLLPGRKGWFPGRACALFCIAGAVSLTGYALFDEQSFRRDPAGYHWLVQSVTGRVVQIQRGKERLRLTLGLEEAGLIDGRRVLLSGDIVVFASEGEADGVLQQSLIRIAGDLVPLPVGGRYARFWGYLTERDVRGVIMRPESLDLLEGPQSWRRALGSIRKTCDTWFACLGQNGSSFMRALVFGDRSGLTREEKEDFAAAGIIHVMAVSGMHIAVASAVFLALLSLAGVGRRLAWPLVFALLLLYAGLCDWTPSVMRAVCMLGLMGLCGYFRSSVPVLDVLLLAGLILFIEDRDVIRQPGFLLSFFATGGIILLSRPLSGVLRWLRVPGWLATTLGVSLAAQLAVVPLLAMFFGRISLVSPLANCVFVPVILSVQALGMVLPLVAWLGADEFVLSFFGTVLDALFAAIHETASLPWAVLETGAFPWWGVLAYTCLILAVIKGSECVVHKRRKDRGLALAAQVAGLLARTGPDGQARAGTEFSRQPAGARTDCRRGAGHTRRRCA